MTFETLSKAIWVSMVEYSRPADSQEKLATVSQAYLEFLDYCLLHGIITADDRRLPAEFDFYLKNVYAYLGDPV